MKNVSTITVNQNASRLTLVVMFALLLLSSVQTFGQNVSTVEVSIATSAITVYSDDNTTATTATATESNANMNMVSWLMGTKQTPKANLDKVVSKKEMINSGIAPNRLLMKAFLKKASNYQSTIA
jgi:hypothetical protein